MGRRRAKAKAGKPKAGGGADKPATSLLGDREARDQFTEAGLVMTNSMRRQFTGCRRRCYWQYVQRLTPRAVFVPYLTGGLFHAELGAAYLGTSGMCDPDVDKPKPFTFDAQLAAARVTAVVEAALKDSVGLTPEDVDKVWMQQAVVCGMVAGHAKRYLKQDRAAWKVLGVEVKDTVLPIRGTGWSLAGALDLLVEEKGKPLIVEHKTTADISASYVARIPLDWQILGYAWLAAAKLGRPVNWVVYNMVKKPTIRQRKGETMEGFLERLEDVYATEPHKYFHRERVKVTAPMVKAFLAELAQFVGEFDRCLETGFWYQNAYACDLRGACPYMRLCLEGPNKANLLHYTRRAAKHAELED